MPAAAANIPPDILSLMGDIERLHAEVAKPGGRRSSSSDHQQFSATTYWGAMKLVGALRAIEALGSQGIAP
ncbi:MAG: hypothetical protein ABIS51_05770 [Sphingomonas sp.]